MTNTLHVSSHGITFC